MAKKYLRDLEEWDVKEGVKISRVYDIAMLFTRYKLYDTIVANHIDGISYNAGVCVPGLRTSLIEARGLFWTVFTATHELGHRKYVISIYQTTCTDLTVEALQNSVG
ncbi:hypothetical protein CHS0354_016510 [Potamilus streckersoni]|uniref:Uncharacterized protein n=1 Tax=Potamilus streckersoni TaxID=2493646 RepID=A0AAE0VWP9_9BIVA|nr:hypothetical protein CHS0354_016510 [Potamilus streckersoni]